MGIPVYLAMTAAEIYSCRQLPHKLAYMACHFSAYGTGLSNLPQWLPPQAIVIINDRIPPVKHNRQQILSQLNELCRHLNPSGLLLDFQRSDPCLDALAKLLVNELPCPIAVTELYAKDLSCPVFLRPAPAYLSIAEHIRNWPGRDIWLDVAPIACSFTIDEQESRYCEDPDLHARCPFYDQKRFVRYGISQNGNNFIFSLVRDADDSLKMLSTAPPSIKCALGLYQQLGMYRPG